MAAAKVYADFQNADTKGRIRLNCVGTLEDLAVQSVELHEGQHLTLYTDDLGQEGQPDELLAEGMVSYSETDDCWVATIDWNAIRRSSEEVVLAAGRESPSATTLDESDTAG